MRLTRFYPTRDLVNVQDELNRMFDQFFTRPGMLPEAPSAWLPAVDVHETDDEYTLQVDLPGVNPKDVKVQMVGDQLSIRGERRSEREQNGGKTHRVERVHGVFERSFSLGAPVDTGKVKATYRDGVLEIRVPKLEEARTREVSIEIAK